MKRQATTPLLSQTQVIQKKPKMSRQPSLINPPLKRGMSIEKKNIDKLDVTISTGATNDFTAPVNLNTVAVGPASTDRVGRKITMRSLYIRGVYSAATASADLRVLVVYDKQANGAVPATNVILSGTPNFNSFQNLNNSDRFVVVADQIISQPQQAATPQYFQIYRKLNLDTLFLLDTNASNSIATGALLILFADDSANAQSITYSSRVRFTDQ